MKQKKLLLVASAALGALAFAASAIAALRGNGQQDEGDRQWSLDEAKAESWDCQTRRRAIGVVRERPNNPIPGKQMLRRVDVNQAGTHETDLIEEVPRREDRPAGGSETTKQLNTCSHLA